MRSVSLIGVGQTPIGHWADCSLSDLAAASLRAALQDAGLPGVQALYVSALPGENGAGAEDVAALAANAAGLTATQTAIETRSLAAMCGGGAALHMAVQAIAAGVHDIMAVTGVGKGNGCRAADSPDEAAPGLTSVGLSALMMRRYMYEYSAQHDDFAGFAITARHNARRNNALAGTLLTMAQYRQSRLLADPLCEFDAAPVCAGSATVIICAGDMAHASAHTPVRVLASDVARDALALHDRADAIWLAGASASAKAAYAQAGLTAQEIDLFELHDASTIMAALSLEAAGFADRGAGVRLAQNGAIGLKGTIPISTLGGLLGRGDAGAASGVYQAIEAALQLRKEAGANQVAGAQIAMVQSLGGHGACAATHILAV